MITTRKCGRDFGVGPGLTGCGKTPPKPVILSPAFGGEGSAFCVFKQMQILRRLLAAQNDIIRGLFPQPVEPETFRPQGRPHGQMERPQAL
jgi:hypothetical protein